MTPAVPFLAPQQAKRLPPPAISLRSKSMTSELEEMGEPVGCRAQVLRGRPAEGAGPSLSLLVLLVTRIPCPHPLPGPWARLWPACVSLGRGDFPPSSCTCFSVGVSQGLYVPLCGSVSFPAPPPSVPPLFSITCHQLPPRPLTEMKASPLLPEWTWGVRFPLTGAGQAADRPHQGAMREAGVPDRGPLASP